MQSVVLLAVVGLLVGANGLKITDVLKGSKSGVESDSEVSYNEDDLDLSRDDSALEVSRDEDDLDLSRDETSLELSHDEGHCLCFRRACWCHGVDDGVKIHATFMVDEIRRRRVKHTLINVYFYIGRQTFEKEFEVGYFDDLCEIVGGKRFCFRIDVKDTGKSGMLQGCLSVTRPHKVDMGCFKVPLMTSEPEFMTSEDSDMAETPNDDDIDDAELIDIDNTDGIDVVEMEAELQTDITCGKGHCKCCEHGCFCHGKDGGYKVSVTLVVDETRFHCDKHTIIMGYFTVGSDSFYKAFEDGELYSFCRTEHGKRFCFDFKEEKECGGSVFSHMWLTQPRYMDFGKFKIPL